MLNDFLVLGQVPGTNFQITFSEMLVALDIALLAILVIKKLPALKKLKHPIAYFYLFFMTRGSQQLRAL
jgi:hypothetical protein